jgi:hypothetical protein
VSGPPATAAAVNRLACCSTSFSACLRPPQLRGGKEGMALARNSRQTGSKAASAAGKVLANPKSIKAEKKAAASALAQTPSKGKGK